MSMNLNTLAFLVRDDVTTITVRFASGSQKDYIFKAPLALTDTLELRDYVVVHTCNGMRAAFVTAIHEEPQVDPEDDIEYDWAFQRIDEDAYLALRDAEVHIEEKLRARRKLSRRQQALAALGINDPGELTRELADLNKE